MTRHEAPSDAEMLPARFQATVYEVEVSTKQAAALDAKALAHQASTTESQLRALGNVARTRVLYRIDQPVNVFSDIITVGSQEPVIIGTRMTDTGQAINTISCQNVGLVLRLSVPNATKEAEAKSPEVTLATNQIGSLDASALTRQAESSAKLLGALGNFGKSQVLYSLAKMVNAYSDVVEISTNVPIVTGSRPNLTGGAINTISYQSSGVSLLLSAQAPPNAVKGGGTNVALILQFSTMAPSLVGIGLSQGSSPVIRSEAVQHSEPLEFGKPRVMLTVSPSSSSDQAPPVAHVVRYLFGPPSNK